MPVVDQGALARGIDELANERGRLDVFAVIEFRCPHSEAMDDRDLNLAVKESVALIAEWYDDRRANECAS